jgi:very-short-patch-repair endonuclease
MWACGQRKRGHPEIGETAPMEWFEVAQRQCGVIDRSQFAASGVTEDSIQGLVARRELRAVFSGVYVHSSGPVTANQRLWAASLWSDGGVISHRSAARLWQIKAEPATTVHLTVADRRFRRSSKGIRLHRVPLPSGDTTEFGALPVTNRARTIIDLLRTERIDVARTLLDRAIQRHWVDVADVGRSISNGLGRAGNVQLRELLAGLEPGADAESERRLHRLLRTAGLTGWVPQYEIRLAGRRCYVDVAFPDLNLAIEVDGKLTHDVLSDRFEDDRERQNALVGAGWRVLRFTWRQLNDRPDWVLQQIVQHVAA